MVASSNHLICPFSFKIIWLVEGIIDISSSHLDRTCTHVLCIEVSDKFETFGIPSVIKSIGRCKNIINMMDD